MNTSALYVDGTNLFAGQYELFHKKGYLDFCTFINVIQKRLSVSFDAIYFYASYSNPNKFNSKDFIINEGLFYKNVRSCPQLQFIKGYRSPTSGKEKEVDVSLAVDVVDQVMLILCIHWRLLSDLKKNSK